MMETTTQESTTAQSGGQVDGSTVHHLSRTLIRKKTFSKGEKPDEKKNMPNYQ